MDIIHKRWYSLMCLAEVFHAEWDGRSKRSYIPDEMLHDAHYPEALVEVTWQHLDLAVAMPPSWSQTSA